MISDPFWAGFVAGAMATTPLWWTLAIVVFNSEWTTLRRVAALELQLRLIGWRVKR